MDEKKIVSVANRDSGSVGYVLPDRNLHRTFEPGEIKKIELEELQQLSYVSGGEYILKHCLIINDMDALSALNLEVEPEYFYTEKEIKEKLPVWSLDELEDTLNFAPDGVIELIKKIAVDTELPDTRKRKLIFEKTGLNIDTAISINTLLNAEDPVEEKDAPKRKVTPSNSGAPERKAAAPKYNVVK